MRAVFTTVLVASCARTTSRPETLDAKAPHTSASGSAAAAVSSTTVTTSPVVQIRASVEASIAIYGAHVMVGAGRIHDVDAPRLESELAAAYERMRADEDDAASTVRFRSTPLAAGDTAEAFVYEPTEHSKSREEPRSAVIFLHGYGGRFALPCWQIARAAARHGFTTACPSIGQEGDWWSADGEGILRKTVEFLRRSGHDRLVLAGLSNGGIGAARLAPKMKGTFAGLVLVSGADPAASSPNVPTLVLQGRRDTMVAPSSSRSYAAKVRGKYVEVDSGHFAMLFRSAEVERAIDEFIGNL
jgi:pimeloyl-ACP methyl ester carboxylesterase